jgi:hypothetical protein
VGSGGAKDAGERQGCKRTEETHDTREWVMPRQ